MHRRTNLAALARSGASILGVILIVGASLGCRGSAPLDPDPSELEPTASGATSETESSESGSSESASTESGPSESASTEMGPSASETTSESSGTDFSLLFETLFSDPLARWLVTYDRVAWVASDRVIEEPEETLQQLGPEWFCYEDPEGCLLYTSDAADE